MILYFSGTGNSEYVAKRIANETKEELLDVFNIIKNNDLSKLHSDTPWILVAPTYAWRIPRILQEWLEKVELSGSKDIYFVMTCGGNIGNAGKYLKKLSTLKKMNYLGCYQIIMPENYIAMFSTPTKEEALKTIQQAEYTIDSMISYIKNKSIFPTFPITIKDRINSSIINRLFYPLFVHAKKFHVEDSCTSCQQCTKVCPLNNISMKQNKPVWQDHCTHCMACISKCPVNAIEYGKHSKDLPRYICPK